MGFVESADRFHVGNGEIIIADRPDDRLLERIKRADRPQLVINGSLGFTGGLHFLAEVGPLLVSLEVVGSFDDDSAIASCTNLIELNLNTDCSNKIEWSELPHLSHLFVYADRLNDSFATLLNLENLHLHGPREVSLVVLQHLAALRHLRLTSAQIPQIPSGVPWTNLRSLSISIAPQLANFSAIGTMSALESLTLERCRHLSNLDFLRSCTGLRFLNIAECGKIRGLGPLEACFNLEDLLFYGNTVVEDGDLSVLGRLPRLERAAYQKRRHYRGAPSRFPTLD